MILQNTLDLPGDPDAVFALLNDAERVAGCLPGAMLEGRDGDAYLGRVSVKVGPVSAVYSAKVRFLDVTESERRLRLSARGADSHGNGDAEAVVTVTIGPGASGATLNLRTDLLVRGRIAQFGKSAISTVSNRVLDQFARNLAALLENGDATQTVAAERSPGDTATVDGQAMLLPPKTKRYLAIAAACTIAAACAIGFFQGWLPGRSRALDKLIKELQRGRD